MNKDRLNHRKYGFMDISKLREPNPLERRERLGGDMCRKYWDCKNCWILSPPPHSQDKARLSLCCMLFPVAMRECWDKSRLIEKLVDNLPSDRSQQHYLNTYTYIFVPLLTTSPNWICFPFDQPSTTAFYARKGSCWCWYLSVFIWAAQWPLLIFVHRWKQACEYTVESWVELQSYCVLRSYLPGAELVL